MRELGKSNLGLKVLAVVWAAMVWLYLAGQPEVESSVPSRVAYTNLKQGLELNPDQTGDVTLVAVGPRRSLSGLSGETLAAVLDLSAVVGPGAYTFNTSDFRLELPPGVRVVRSVPSQIHVRVERQETKQVKIQPAFLSNYPEGYALSGFNVEPEYLTVVGPANRLALIDQVATDPVDLAEVRESRTFEVSAQLPDPYLRFESEPRVRVEVFLRHQ